MSAVTEPLTQCGERLIGLIAGRRFHCFVQHISPSCRLRGLTPNNIYGAHDIGGVEATFRTWFGNAETIAVHEQSVEPVGGRFRLRYVLDIVDNGNRTLVEQVGYFDVVDDRITDLTLVCSGHRPYDGEQES